METQELSIFYACWIPRGRWEIRVDTRHQDNGHAHIHIRRRRNAKGEFSWNADGSRHDKGKFPVNEAMIGKAKEIAANELKIPISSLDFLTGVPNGGHLRVYQDHGLDAITRVYAVGESVILVSENWFIILSPDLDENPESAEDQI